MGKFLQGITVCWGGIKDSQDNAYQNTIFRGWRWCLVRLCQENSEMSGFRSFCDHPRFYRFFQEQLLTIVEIWAASGIWKRSSPDLSLTSVPDNQWCQVSIGWKNLGQPGNNKIHNYCLEFSLHIKTRFYGQLQR